MDRHASALVALINLMDRPQRHFYAEMARVELARRCSGCSTSAPSFPETGGYLQQAGPRDGPAEAHDHRGEGLLLDLAFLGSSLCGEKNREQVELMQLNRGETGWRSIWRSCRPRRCWKPNCTRPYGWRKGRWKGSQRTEVDAWPGCLLATEGSSCSQVPPVHALRISALSGSRPLHFTL